MDDFQGACGGATSAALYTCLGLRLRLRMGMLSMDMHDSVGEPSPSLSACAVTYFVDMSCLCYVMQRMGQQHAGRYMIVKRGDSLTSCADR